MGLYTWTFIMSGPRDRERATDRMNRQSMPFGSKREDSGLERGGGREAMRGHPATRSRFDTAL
jgi:hypothetical protein